MSEAASDKEAIQLSIVNAQMNEYDPKNKNYLGTSLYDKTVANSDKWDLIVNNQTGQTYGDDWRIIREGEQLLDYGKASKNYLANYKTGEIIEVDDNYLEISFKDTLGVTDGLVFNMDASNMDQNLSNWGDNVTLRYFDDTIYDTTEKRQQAYNEQKTYGSVKEKDDGYDRQISTNSADYIDQENHAFKFNGNNYIEVYNENGFDFSNGLTFEFYGKLLDKFNGTMLGLGAKKVMGFLDFGKALIGNKLIIDNAFFLQMSFITHYLLLEDLMGKYQRGMVVMMRNIMGIIRFII